MRTLPLFGLCALLACACGPSRTADTASLPPIAPAPAAAPQPAAVVPVAPPPEGRLGDIVTPREYDVELSVDPEESSFRGRVRIDVNVAQPVSSFWIHGSGITVERSSLLFGSGPAAREIPLAPLAAPKDSELLGFSAGESVPPGRAALVIEYRATMGQRTGLFRQRHEGNWYAITDFEPIDARRAIPCFDDPRFKVPWNLTLVVPESLSAYANAPEAEVTALENGERRVRFERTRPLPSYLVAFAVGPFEVVQAPGGPVPIRILALRGKASWASYARTIAPPLLARLVRYFGSPVPFSKIDFVAVPSFSGAMENPGLITVSASILLQEPGEDRIELSRLAALVIAHELSHLWLGDLVTMSYWDDLWLNEGAATWLAAKILAEWHPAQKWSVHDVASSLEAIAVDSQLDAPPVRHAIDAKEDIRAAFDPISYKKGGALFGMLEAWLGESLFHERLLAYVARNADGSVTADRFLAAFSDGPDEPSARWLRTFLDQPGVPDVSAHLSCQDGAPRVELSQARYLPLAAAASARSAQRAQTWQVPVCVRYGDRTGVGRACTLLERKTGAVELSRCPAWFYPNVDERGYYRVSLAAAGLRNLAGAKRPKLTDREVVGLTANAVAMLASGKAELADVLPVFDELARDRNLAATRLIAQFLAYLDRAVINRKSRASFQSFVRKLYGKRSHVLDLHAVEGEDEETALMRPLLLSLIGHYGRDPRTITRATRQVNRWLASGERTDSQLFGTVMTVAASAGGRRLFDRLAKALAETDLSTAEGRQRRQLLLAGLGSFSKPALLRRAVSLALDRQAMSTDLVILFEAIFQNPDSASLSVDLLEETQQQLLQTSRDPRALYRTAYLAMVAGRRACSRAEWQRIEALVHTGAGGRNPDWLVEGLADLEREVEQCAAFRARYQADADAFFK